MASTGTTYNCRFESECNRRRQRPHSEDAISDGELRIQIVLAVRLARTLGLEGREVDRLYAICERTGRLKLWERCMDRVQPRDEFGSREKRKGPSPRATPVSVYWLYGTYRWGGR